MGLFDIFKSRKQDDDALSPMTLTNRAWAAVFKSRKKDDLAETAFLHVSQRLFDALPELDNLYRLEVCWPAIPDRASSRITGSHPDSRREIDTDSKGFNLGLIKKRAFFAVFMAGAFNSRFREDTKRFAILFQAASGAATNGILDQPEQEREIAPDLNRFMLAVFTETSSALSTMNGFLETIRDDPLPTLPAALRPLSDLYHEVYLACFGQNRYLSVSNDGTSLRDEFHSHVQTNIQFCFKTMYAVVREIEEIQKHGSFAATDIEIVTSQLLPFPDAIDIVAPFGLLVAELNDIKRYNLDIKDNVPFSLPLMRLAHSKHQIQTALAIVIAEYVVQFARERSSHARGILGAASFSSGDLAWFTVQPIFGHTTKPYADLMRDGQAAYFRWSEGCDRYLKTIAGQPTNSSGGSSWPSPRDLSKYWRTVDRSVPELLERPVLRAIRDI